MASGGLLGYSPIAPGTAGSLLGVLLYIPLSGLPVVYYAAFLLFASLLSFKIADTAERYFGKKDCQVIVIDEVVGVFFTMFLFPPTLAYLSAGFLIFRFFDIVKPFPAGWVDRNIKGGIGVVLDDIVAGIYSNITLWLLAILL
ncbi:MAG TPA: phosphatidylglycerophosphatase A [Thermodesulfobacteriota bacterium]|nr:phosphatidylglycerophosphatase A [Thermodesulfobacteriota bacterium]